MVNLPFHSRPAIRSGFAGAWGPSAFSSESAYTFELGWVRKVAGSEVADFSHPAWNQPLEKGSA